MLNFLHLTPQDKPVYDRFLRNCGQRGCEYSFVNLYLWGRQKAAVHGENLAFFCQFNRKSVYLFPLGQDLKLTIDAIISDAQKRGIPCRLTSLTEDDKQWLETAYPGRFHFHTDRDSYDYLYSAQALATLKGKKLQKKRNHFNKFRLLHPNYFTEPITVENTPEVEAFLCQWFTNRAESDDGDYLMEQVALSKALRHWDALELEGLILRDKGRILAITIGSSLSDDTFDIHFEKALDSVDGAYTAINREFARYLTEKYPGLLWLNREDDLGLEGLRKAKLSYHPELLIKKYWACLREDGYEY